MVGNEPSKIDRQTSWVINSQHWYNCSMMGILDDILWSPWIKYLSSMVSFFSRALGTPNNDIWPEVESLPDYKNTFPKWKSGNLSSMVKNLDKNGIDLLAVRQFPCSPNIYSDWLWNIVTVEARYTPVFFKGLVVFWIVLVILKWPIVLSAQQ